MIKYYLHPGMVTSIHDGEEHLISEKKLMELYHLDPRECCWDGRCMAKRQYSLINLYPLKDGLYTEEKILQILGKNI
jgi:hypothetical protein